MELHYQNIQRFWKVINTRLRLLTHSAENERGDIVTVPVVVVVHAARLLRETRRILGQYPGADLLEIRAVPRRDGHALAHRRRERLAGNQTWLSVPKV